MNIFFTDKCPVECAKFLDDKRVVKMCLETAQILSTAVRQCGYVGDNAYKQTHANHPSCVWARQTRSNYDWTVRHLIALCKEYTYRYGKIHKCAGMVSDFQNLSNFIPIGDLTDFANCAANASLGISYKSYSDVHLAYKLYLNDRWDNDKREPKWTNRVA